MEAYINLGRFQAQEVKLACHYYSSAITDMALFPLFLHLSFPTILVSCFIVESFNFFDWFQICHSVQAQTSPEQIKQFKVGNTSDHGHA